MRTEEKNGKTGLVILLGIMVIFAIYQIFVAPMLVKKEEPSNSNEPVETEEERIAKISEELYQVFSLSLLEESILTIEDKTYLEGTLTLYEMSDGVKIYLGIKNLEDKYFTKDDGYRVKDALAKADGNYYYGGSYIMKDALVNSMTKIFGEGVPIEHQTITLDDVRYVYNEHKDRYDIWTVRTKPEPTVKKITYKEVVNNSDELYIYEYVAYTDFANPDALISSTVHNSNLEVIILQDNVQDYLSYMDKYRYVFQKQEDGSYLFKSIEYVEE